MTDRTDSGPSNSAWPSVVVQLAVFFLGCELLYSRWIPEASGLLGLGLTLLTVILNLRFWVGGCLLLAVQVELFLRERPYPREDEFPAGDLLAVLSVLLLAYLSCRLNLLGRELRRQGRRLPIRFTGPEAFFESLREILLDGIMQVRRLRNLPTFSAELGQAGRRILLPTLVAMGILLLSPPEAEAVESLRLTPSGFRTLKIGLALAGLSLGLSALFRAWEWRRMTPTQARLSLRSDAYGFMNRELRPIIRRRLKTRPPQSSPSPTPRH